LATISPWGFRDPCKDPHFSPGPIGKKQAAWEASSTEKRKLTPLNKILKIGGTMDCPTQLIFGPLESLHNNRNEQKGEDIIRLFDKNS